MTHPGTTPRPHTASAPHALVSGASIAGLSTAFWLARIGWRVTVIERAPAFRDGGQNVDVRGIARDVLQRMGLTEQVRALTTTEEGTSVVDDHGRVIAAFPVEEADGPTAELEILRGDLARTVLAGLPQEVDVRYGDWIEDVHQIRPSSGADGASGTSTASAPSPTSRVRVKLHSGAEEVVDLLVIAEGVRSRTRDHVFGQAVRRRPLGLNMAYGTIDRIAQDDRWWRWYFMPGSRQMTLRPDNVGSTRATLAYLSDFDLSAVDSEQARAELTRVFADTKWQTPRVVHGFRVSQDVYVDHLTQITMDSWSTGRVCLTGDAAWCVTPLGGGGTSLALTGGYVLAAALSRHHTSHSDGELDAALREYEAWMRPLVDQTQKMPPGSPRLFYPRTTAGVRLFRLLARAAAAKVLRGFAARLSHVARTDQELPAMELASASR